MAQRLDPAGRLREPTDSRANPRASAGGPGRRRSRTETVIRPMAVQRRPAGRHVRRHVRYRRVFRRELLQLALEKGPP